MTQAMDVLLSAVASDLIGRLVSFLIGMCQESRATDDTVVRLQRALLRSRAIVEEAEVRQVANRAMLLQLNHLRGELCRGSYVLDAHRRRAIDPSRRSHATVSRLRSFCRPTPGTGDADGLAMVVESLEAALSDMREFVVLLGGCPRVTRQPYSAYLFMERCMFGRQMEKEEIIGFLLQPVEDLDVLPIIGPREVGKRTLVEHVCLDARVREHFVKFHRLSSDDLDLLSHDQEHHHGLIEATARSLFVIDLAGGDANDEERWRRFHSSVSRRAHRESKIILVSRTEAHASLGTVPPLRLRAPRRDELWYFFRALAFGAADPEDRPELARVAMALCAGIHDDALFTAANIIASWLRADLSASSWRRVLNVFAGATEKPGCYYLFRPVKDAPSTPLLFHGRRKSTGTAQGELPKVTMLELVTGGAVPGGETQFDVLVWQSRIPPYGCYVATCDMERARLVVAGQKRARKRRRQRDDHQRADV